MQKNENRLELEIILLEQVHYVKFHRFPSVPSISHFRTYNNDILQCPTLTMHEEVQCSTWQEVVP